MKREEFLTQVQQPAGLETPGEAERWSRAVLMALADLVTTPADRRQFVTQLPGFLKSPLLDAPLRGMPMTRDAFFQHVGHALHVHVPEAQRAVETVYRALRQAIATGELEDFEARIPPDITAWLVRIR
jgi:uncharacterized protein (DUF2267 family)